MLNCDDFLAEFGNLLEGKLKLELRRELQAHLAHCQTCQVIYDSTRKTVKIITESGSFELPESLSESIAAQVMARIRNT